MLKLANCRDRQARLLTLMQEQGLDLCVTANPKTVYYFTGALVDPALPQAFGIGSSGKSLLVTNRQPDQAAAGDVHCYTAYSLHRVFSRTTMYEEAAAAIVRRFHGLSGPAAFEFEYVGYDMGRAIQSFSRYRSINLSPYLQEMRRRKDPDEIECMRATIGLVEAAYAALKARLARGMTEYEAYLIAQEAMVNAAQTSVALNGDFASGVRGIKGGGPPTDRRLEPGDLYILDLFPLYQGYVCDLCRTFVVGRPTTLQQETWEHVLKAHDIARKLLRPGAAGCEIYEAVREHLLSFRDFRNSFTHHLGHGVGMDGWEYPWITPGSEQRIREGEVIAIEPGLYGESLKGGIRLEHNYLVGPEGAEPLDRFGMEL